MTVHANSSIARVEVSGRSYPAVSERRCRVCCSALRGSIEEETVAGRSWAAIAAELSPEAGINARNIRDHFAHDHMPVREATVQALASRQAEQRGQAVEQAVAVAVNYVDFCEAIVGSVSRRVATGEVEPTVRDALAAAAVLARFDPGSTVSDDDYLEGFIAYHETVAEVLTPAQFQDLSQRLADHPVLAALAEQWDANHA